MLRHAQVVILNLYLQMTPNAGPLAVIIAGSALILARPDASRLQVVLLLWKLLWKKSCRMKPIIATQEGG